MKRPATLHASIGGYFGSSYSLELEGERLRYRVYREGRVVADELLAPNDDEWAAFVAALDDARVWSWQSSYENPGVTDGTSWSLKLDIDGRKLSSWGSNAFPSSFKRVTREISTLVGGRDFE